MPFDGCDCRDKNTGMKVDCKGAKAWPVQSDNSLDQEDD
jgi:hypothetical protein